MNEIDAATGSALRTHRLHAGFTQQDIAARLGIGQGAVAKWERGQVPMRLRDAVSVCQMLGIELADLWNEPASQDRYQEGIQRGLEMSRQAIERLA